jgi:hypothetical protein
VDVAQSVELLVVVQAVAGSNPVVHLSDVALLRDEVAQALEVLGAGGAAVEVGAPGNTLVRGRRTRSAPRSRRAGQSTPRR